jgi:hypothetical protein
MRPFLISEYVLRFHKPRHTTTAEQTRAYFNAYGGCGSLFISLFYEMNSQVNRMIDFRESKISSNAMAAIAY